jgi:hypothetical protein
MVHIFPSVGICETFIDVTRRPYSSECCLSPHERPNEGLVKGQIRNLYPSFLCILRVALVDFLCRLDDHDNMEKGLWQTTTKTKMPENMHPTMPCQSSRARI